MPLQIIIVPVPVFPTATNGWLKHTRPTYPPRPNTPLPLSPQQPIPCAQGRRMLAEARRIMSERREHAPSMSIVPMSAKPKAWVHVPIPAENGSVSIRKSSIIAVTEARGIVTVTLSGTSTQLKISGVTRDRLMLMIEPPRYDEDDNY